MRNNVAMDSFAEQEENVTTRCGITVSGSKECRQLASARRIMAL
jgi:hypothetical protein